MHTNRRSRINLSPEASLAALQANDPAPRCNDVDFSPATPQAAPVTVLTLGAVLKNLLDQIDTTIISARNSGDLLELQTAQSLKGLIEQLQTAILVCPIF